MTIVSGHRWRGNRAHYRGVDLRLNVTLRQPADALEGEVQVAPFDEREFNFMGGARVAFKCEGGRARTPACSLLS